MPRVTDRRLVCLALALAAGSPNAFADDWSNSGGNAGRNGRTSELGPDAPTPLWSGGRPSIIAWQPVIEGDRVFMVRQTSFPPESTGSPVVAMDLNTGAELWATHIPAQTGDWTAWVAGVKNGRVYASRAGNGASVAAWLYCLDAATGAIIWHSDIEIDAGAYDGVVFAEDGDPIIASFRNIWRINAENGDTVWVANRTCSVSGNCGGAIGGGAVYVVDAVAGGHAFKKFDLATGAFQYQSPVMPGFLTQNTPMVGPDGTVYLNRVQNNAAVDFFYAFTDNGSAFTQKWSAPASYSTGGEFGVGNDGSVYMLMPGDELVRLHPDTGAVVSTAGPLAGFDKPRMAIDSAGRLFISNGAFGTGRLYSFNADLTLRWDVPVTNVNIGGPAIGGQGTLVVAGVGADVRAYRTDHAGACYANCDQSTIEPVLNVADFTCFLQRFAGGESYANCDQSTTAPVLNVADFTCFLQRFAAGCP
jgi:outer membrane protein assembly factor BamB